MKLASSLFVLTVLGSLAGCTRDSSAQIPPPPESQFVVLNTGSQSLTPTTRQTRILYSLQDYAAELARYTNDPALAVDFVQGRYLLVDMGQRASGGNSIVVTSVDVFDDSVRANVKLTRPGLACPQLPVITNPFQFVFIPTQKEVLVSETVEATTCP